MPLTHLEYQQLASAIAILRSGGSVDGNRTVYSVDIDFLLKKYTEGYEPPNPHPEQKKPEPGPGAQPHKP
jgi:hypothetical protein